MTSKRGSQALRPRKPGEWLIRHASKDAADGWTNLCAQQPGNIATLYDRLAKDPRQIDNRDRQGPLKGDLGRATVNGEVLEQWQYEIAGGGRVWYAVQDNDRVVWITKAAARHPNETK